MVPRAGVEPARPFGQRILSPQRLPFRHPGMLSVSLNIPRISVSLKHEYPNVDTSVRGRCGTTLSTFLQGSASIATNKSLLGPPRTH